MEKYDSTRPEKVQLQDECTLLEFQVLHHEDVALGSKLEMTLEAILHLLMRLEAHKM